MKRKLFFILLAGLSVLHFDIKNYKSNYSVWLSREASILINLPVISNLDDNYNTAYVNVYTDYNNWKYVNVEPDHVAWFENGLSLDTLNKDTAPLVFNKKVNNKYWLDISKPKAREYVLNLFKDFRSKYSNQVHLDDHWAIPSELGNYSTELTDLTKEVVEIVGPLSISVHSKNYALQKYNQDWYKWLELNLVNEIILQNYVRENFTTNMDKFILDVSKFNVKYSIGIYLGEVISPLYVKDLIQQVEDRELEVVLFPFRTAVVHGNY